MAGIRQFEAWLDQQADDVGATIARQMLKEFRKTVPKNRPARRAVSKAVDDAIIGRVKHLDACAYSQHWIAAHLNVNQGRVNEILKGRKVSGGAPEARRAPPGDLFVAVASTSQRPDGK